MSWKRINSSPKPLQSAHCARKEIAVLQIVSELKFMRRAEEAWGCQRNMIIIYYCRSFCRFQNIENSCHVLTAGKRGFAQNQTIMVKWSNGQIYFQEMRRVLLPVEPLKWNTLTSPASAQNWTLRARIMRPGNPGNLKFRLKFRFLFLIRGQIPKTFTFGKKHSILLQWGLGGFRMARTNYSKPFVKLSGDKS